MTPGCFVISLDFELYWGVRDVVALDDYRQRLLGERDVIPAMLELFARYGVHVTWAAVGFLFARDRGHLEASFPRVLPTYADPSLSPYRYAGTIGRTEADDPFHYAAGLLERIAQTPGQEIGTHTFSHYYCLERGQTAEQFEADLAAAARIGERFGTVCNSLVFPRNQYNPSYRDVLRRAGVRAYRSNGPGWAYRPRAGAHDSPLRRIARLADSYAPLFGAGARAPGVFDDGGPIDIPASAFLRPLTPKTFPFRCAQLERIGLGMRRAAECGELFHLWWHPHNFGMYGKQNLEMLDAILQRFDTLRRRYGFMTSTMNEAAGWARGRDA
ncbi:MAG TPA: polysaccharide deacetylase family protein [Polyangiaceae bacterium]|jgi:peptidoglycan/xylan/chitin deacetylase (PgdA/CDA1 family)|nr:polysaccharide deacetylase family protein [Polyangiaceae bacterium]